MRFAEKSFEIRFCAALSAALMPFNRNPQWFGLTQAQERKAGVDAILQQGGRLLVFQFKAAKKQNASSPSVLDFKLEIDQAKVLANFSKNHPQSTFYIFPGHGTVSQASAKNCHCLLEQSYWVTAQQIENTISTSTKIKKTQQSVTARLNTPASTLTIHNGNPPPRRGLWRIAHALSSGVFVVTLTVPVLMSSRVTQAQP